jgi:hypothetical protein
MKSNDLIEALKVLAAQRPVFHSEADFQHALAWLLHERHPAANVRLEYRPARLKRKAYIDIWIEAEGAIYAIELKYKTRGLRVTVGGEPFDLLNQSAQDQARYDFCRDINRLETLAKYYPGLTGFALLLTNDPNYWRPGGRESNIDMAFRLHEGAVLEGTLDWASHASSGSKSGRINPISLSHKYVMKWTPYSTNGDLCNSEFRMTMVATTADE